MELKHYERLTQQAIGLIDGETDFIANLANLSALLNMELDDINWVGFYRIINDELVLGPFQGKVAANASGKTDWQPAQHMAPLCQQYRAACGQAAVKHSADAAHACSRSPHWIDRPQH